MKSLDESTERKNQIENFSLEEFNSLKIDYENERSGERALMKRTDEWLMDDVLAKCGNGYKIFLPQLYYDITKDETDDGCLQFLNGVVNENIKYIDLLAWTGLKFLIKKKFSIEEFHLRQDEIFNRFETTLGIKRHISSGHIIEYLKKILKSRLSIDQYKYIFGNTKGFRSGDDKLSIDSCLDHIETACKAHCFERDKKMDFEEKALGFKKGDRSFAFYSKINRG